MRSRRTRLRSIWNRVGSGELHQAPRQWQAWLSDTGSLTQKIERAIGQKLEVLVLSDGRQTLNSDESRYFQFKLRRCRVREVLLCANQIPLVMAHSIIPTTSACGSNQPVLRLGKKPLGAALFAKSHQHTKRKDKQKNRREIAYLNKRATLRRQCEKKYPALPTSVWARRTLYHLKAHPVLVTEIFLPSLLSYLTKP
jgi:chorismate--pyruvate lyase